MKSAIKAMASNALLFAPIEAGENKENTLTDIGRCNMELSHRLKFASRTKRYSTASAITGDWEGGQSNQKIGLWGN